MSFCLNPSCSKPHNSAAAHFCQTCGSKLRLRNRYRAIKAIGQGGFGRTFLAVDEDKPSQPYCVIKQFFYQDQGTRNAQKAAELFYQEAVQLEELGQHPQIPDLFAYFEEDNRQYLIQEYIEGPTLAQELTELGPFNEEQIRHLLKSLLPVLQVVHNHRIIHRDIKPENIIHRQSNQQLVLVDFGAAKVLRQSVLARTGTQIGSAEYAAPEQTMGKAVFASDLYSLGITCVHLLTQIPPFDLFDNSEGRWVWKDFLHGRVSSQLIQILDKLLQTPIKLRYQSAGEVLADLNRKPTLSIASQNSEKTPTSAVNSTTSVVQPLGEGSTIQRIRFTYILWIIGLVFGTGLRPLKGLHRIYNGKIFTGLLWMIPVIGDIGQIFDLFVIPKMVEEYEEKAQVRMGLSLGGVPVIQPPAIAQTIKPPTRDEQMLKILKAAQARGGRLSVTQAVLDTNISFSEVESILKEMVKAGYVSIGNDLVSGVITYYFNEL